MFVDDIKNMMEEMHGMSQFKAWMDNGCIYYYTICPCGTCGTCFSFGLKFITVSYKNPLQRIRAQTKQKILTHPTVHVCRI